MDSLGGILTNGLLGNPILSHFNLSLFNFINIVVEHIGGNSHGYQYIENDKTSYGRIIFKIKIFKREYAKTFNISDNKINIVMKLSKSLRKLKERVISVTINKQVKIDNIKVKINAKN